MSVRPPRVLIVDDEEVMRSLLEKILAGRGYEVVSVGSGEEALSRYRRGDWDVVLADLKMPGMDGLALLSFLHEHEPDLPVVMLTAYGTVETAVEAMRRGARDFLLKPAEPDRVRLIVARILEEGRLLREVEVLRSYADQRQSSGELVGVSPAMRRVYGLMDRVAGSDVPVLILGESGTGKELAARAIHLNSGRRDGSFVAVNAAALEETLLESELFGHEAGSFTGAFEARPGVIEQAAGGTLFLDEVAAGSASFQAKLLRVIETREVLPVGGRVPRPVDFRLITATNRDLTEEIESGRFRDDLYYRIAGVEIRLPPLRERREDILLLAHHFTEQGGEGKQWTTRALEALRTHDWPGNVRELRNAVTSAAARDTDGKIDLDDLSGGLVPGQGEGSLSWKDARERFEREYLEGLLRSVGGNVTEAARRAGLGRATLNDRLRRLGVKAEVFRT